MPAIIAQVSASLYNIIDSIFVGQGVGPLAISGLALTMPVMNLSAAFGAMVNLLLDEELAEYKNMLHLDENSRILCISTEGDTDKENYQNVVWRGKYSKFDE